MKWLSLVLIGALTVTQPSRSMDQEGRGGLRHRSVHAVKAMGYTVVTVATVATAIHKCAELGAGVGLRVVGESLLPESPGLEIVAVALPAFMAGACCGGCCGCGVGVTAARPLANLALYHTKEALCYKKEQ